MRRSRAVRVRPAGLGQRAARLPEARRARAGAWSRPVRTPSLLADEGRLGGLYFEGRVHPFETFLVFAELGALPRLLLGATFDVEATTLAVVDLQEAYAKALLVDREALREAQEFGDALYGYGVLLDAFKTDVREVCAAARVALGAAEDPIVALRQSGYVGGGAV